MILLAEKMNPLWFLLSIVGVLIISVLLYTKQIKKRYYYNVYSYASVKLALIATLGIGILLILNNKGVFSHWFGDSVSLHTINIILGIIALGLFTWVVYNNFRATNIWHSFPLSIIQISYVIILSPLYIFHIALNILGLVKVDNSKKPNIQQTNPKSSLINPISSINRSISSNNSMNIVSTNEIIIKKYNGQDVDRWWVYDGHNLKKYNGQDVDRWWVYDGHNLKKYNGQDVDRWWVYDGHNLKKYNGQDVDRWWITTGKVPIPVLAVAVGICY